MGYLIPSISVSIPVSRKLTLSCSIRKTEAICLEEASSKKKPIGCSVLSPTISEFIRFPILMKPAANATAMTNLSSAHNVCFFVTFFEYIHIENIKAIAAPWLAKPPFHTIGISIKFSA